MRRRYHYTPRRDGPPGKKPPPLPSLDGNPQSMLPFALPAIVVPALVLVIVWLTSGGSSAGCSGSGCTATLGLGNATVAATALGASSSPGPAQITPTPGPPPQITALSAAILEMPCGRTVYALNEHTTYPPASLTKMMTALVAAKKGDLSQTVTSPIDGGALSAATDSTVIGLTIGQQMTLRDLLYGMLMRSGSDAALAVAATIGGSETGFVQMMNDEATALSLADTHFTNPHGLDDPKLYTSAYDIARIGIELLRNPDLAQIVKTKEYTPDGATEPWENIDLFLSQYPGAIGVKTGYTDTAGQTLVAAAEKNGRTLVASVMHSGDEYVDAGALLDWAFSSTTPACS
ncbi:MAG: D-alanyl-D-alanine carboxypeptidase family protein [Chloroflexota bacterium]